MKRPLSLLHSNLNRSANILHLVTTLFLTSQNSTALTFSKIRRSTRIVDWNFLPLQTFSMEQQICHSHNYNSDGVILSFEEEHALQRKIKAKRAEEMCQGRSLKPMDILHHCILYHDEHIVVANKPSGILCVPGIHNRESSLASIVFRHFGNDSNRVDRMVVHRLDMHTSGLVIFARSDEVQKTLHGLFRDRDTAKGIRKKYEALLCGSLVPNDGEINLPLHRDIDFPPFMRVATEESTLHMKNSIETMKMHDGWKKKISKTPKESLTTFEVIRREEYDGESVTRVNLTPVTGR